MMYSIIPLCCIGYGLAYAAGDRIHSKIYLGLIVGDSLIVGKTLAYGAYTPGGDTLTVRLAQIIIVLIGTFDSIFFFAD